MTAVAEGKTVCSHLLSPSSVTEIDKNEARCQQIMECQKQIRVWQDKLSVLLAEQERYCKLTKLRLDASSNWKLLPPEDRLDKFYILAALESEKLPESLKSFGQGIFPLSIRTDRDIFLARLRHKDFERTFRHDANLIVPPILCDDKDILLKIVQRQPLAIRTMPDYWRDDKDVLLSLLGHPDLPSDTLQYFSNEIRSDSELMFQVFQHPNSEFSWIEQCSESLRSNKHFLTRVVEGFHRIQRRTVHQRLHNMEPRNQILQYASQPLQRDFEFVMICVQQSGGNLEYASGAIQRDKTIVEAACLQESEAIRFCASVAVEEKLVDHNEFANSIVPRAPPEVLRLCLEIHGDDEELCILSLINEHLEWSMIPEQRRSDVDFVAKALERRYDRLWGWLPLDIQRNLEVASRVSEMEGLLYHQLSGIIESCPEILSDWQVIKNLFCNKYWNDLIPRIIEKSAIDIQNDKEIMLQATKKKGKYWEHCSEQLRVDEDILLAAAKDCSAARRILDGIYQLEHPNFVARVMQNHPQKLDRIYDHVRPEMWQNREVAMAWLSGGGEWLDWRFPPEFTEDKEMILTTIKHHWFKFRKASDALKNDKDFVLQALEIDSRTISNADDYIFFDDDMVLVAFSRDIRAIQFYVEGDETCFAFLVAFARKIRRRLQDYRAFQDEFIASIMKSPKETAPGGCLLPMLNQGRVMLKTYENKIASYAGILVDQGEELARYESVSMNLAQWGI